MHLPPRRFQVESASSKGAAVPPSIFKEITTMATKKIADKIIKSTCVFTANTLEPKAAAVLISGNEIDAYMGPDTQLYDLGTERFFRALTMRTPTLFKTES